MKIIQLTSYPNPNELGLGNTNETYIRIENSLNVSDIFPINTDVQIVDSNTHAKYVVKAKIERSEFRINKLGQLYRDYNVNPGDEIKFTYIENQDNKTIFFTVKNYKRVFLSVGSKGTEIVNMDNIAPFIVVEALQEYNIPINEGILSLKFLKSEKKRSDSPSETDFFSSFVNDTALAKGNYFITLNDDGNVLEVVKKNVVEEYSLLDDSQNKTPNQSANILSHQQIFYGAPGTGKSHKIKEQLAGVSKDNIFRTTFHPDSDYSTFVGAYKPTMEKTEEQLYNKEELISKLTELKEQGVTYSPQKFGAKYWHSLKQLTLQDKKNILTACEMSDNYTVEFDKGIAVGEELLKKSKESRIIYKFIPQAFLNAYIQAYRTTENVYLIIEEINRGNCAQIFGDLFQLLDRDENGISEYTIKADADLKSFLENELGKDSDAIKDGELCLPSNLYIYATMNTSDQSLFPIDSAFKRRWDWEYEPIKYKNTNWVININGNKYSWVSFQHKINDKILEATSSEDKMLGDYFVNPADGVITEKILLNKILFYLWNDVCKDGEGDIFKISETTDICFSDLHGEGGSEKLVSMMKYLGVSLENNTIEENLDIKQLDQESKTWYLNLWTDIRKSLENNGQQNLPNARDRQTYQLSVGLTGVSVLANISKTKANGFVCYYVEKQQANDIYPKLLNLKDTIENSLGELEWHREDNKYGIAKRNIELTSINDSSTRNELIEQISKLLIDFKATIIPFVDQLR